MKLRVPIVIMLQSVETTKRIPTAICDWVELAKPSPPMAMRQKNMKVIPLI